MSLNLKKWSSKKKKKKNFSFVGTVNHCVGKEIDKQWSCPLCLSSVWVYLSYIPLLKSCCFSPFFPLFPIENETDRDLELFHKFLWLIPNCLFEFSVEWIKKRVFWICLKLKQIRVLNNICISDPISASYLHWRFSPPQQFYHPNHVIWCAWHKLSRYVF